MWSGAVPAAFIIFFGLVVLFIVGVFLFVIGTAIYRWRAAKKSGLDRWPETSS